jgi:hypothetical protein
MTHDEISELLGAYALDAVDGRERAIIEDHLASCARCRAEVQDHREVATLLAHTGGDAPEGLWQRISGSLEESPPGLRLVPESAPTNTVASWRRLGPRLAAGAAAAAVAIVALLGVEMRRQDRRIDELQVALADPLVSAFDAAITDPDSRLIELTTTGDEVVLRGVITDDGIGYLSATALPDLQAGRTYQLWGGAGDQLVSLGVLGNAPRIVSFMAEPYELLAITEEESPGVVTSRNAPVAAGSTA